MRMLTFAEADSARAAPLAIPFLSPPPLAPAAAAPLCQAFFGVSLITLPTLPAVRPASPSLGLLYQSTLACASAWLCRSICVGTCS